MSAVGHLISPTSKGLFNKLVIQSGTYSPLLPTLAQKQPVGLAVAAAVGCSQSDPAALVACMRAVPVANLVAAEGNGTDPASLQEWNPTEGGATLPMQPLPAISASNFNKVPVIIGSMHDDARYFVAIAFDLAGTPLQAAAYPQAVTALFQGLPVPPATILAQYPLSKFATPDLAYSQVFTDAGFACSSAFMADLLVKKGTPVFQYEMAVEDEALTPEDDA